MEAIRAEIFGRRKNREHREKLDLTEWVNFNIVHIVYRFTC